MFETLDPRAFLFAATVFVVAVAVAWMFRRWQVTDSIGFIAIIVLPLLAYGIVSGEIAKVSAPGGWAAEFRAVAADPIKPTPLIDEVEDISIIEKAGLDALQQQRETIQVGRPVAISLTIGRRHYYSERAIASYIRAFLPFDPDLTVIFVEELGGRFVASSNGNSVLAALELQDYDQRFVRAIEDSDLLALRRLIVLTTNSVRAETTNAEALQMMVADGVDAIIKTDERDRPIGLVRKDEIISRLMVKLSQN